MTKRIVATTKKEPDKDVVTREWGERENMLVAWAFAGVDKEWIPVPANEPMPGETIMAMIAGDQNENVFGVLEDHRDKAFDIARTDPWPPPPPPPPLVDSDKLDDIVRIFEDKKWPRFD